MVSEKIIQDRFVSKLTDLGYTYLGSHLNVSDLKPVFRENIERLNAKLFTDNGLTDTEFARLLTTLNTNKGTIFDFVRYGVELMLDDNRIVTIALMDRQDNSRNFFQVTDELIVPGARDRRLDVILFMNGLPVVAVELKKPSARRGALEAFDDISTYLSENVYDSGLLKGIQLFIGSNGVDTQYYAADGRNIFSKGFAWATEDNTVLKDLTDTINTNTSFTDSFLNQDNLHQFIIHHMLKTNPPKERIIALRPYQVHATNKVMNAVLNTNSSNYVWHSTGSGKTLTMFKITKNLSESNKFGKIVVLLDRIDLANQTIEEYVSFGADEGRVMKGAQLVKALTDPNTKIVVTTIQSFASMLNRRPKTAHKISRTKTAFIVDECHRSTFGEQLANIKKMYNSNAQYVGFTGTPIMANNNNRGEQITSDIFGSCAHKYTLHSAIRDGNVLPFEVDTINITHSVPDGTELGRQYFTHSQRYDFISETIAKDFYKYTGQRFPIRQPNAKPLGYNAMLACDSISSAYQYWTRLHTQMAAQGRTTAVVFSVTNKENVDNDETQTSYSMMAEIFAAYDTTHTTNFATRLTDGESINDIRKDYVQDLTKRIKNLEIDLIIVSSMLLTGFDAPTMNTLYVDKPLKEQSLIQAISRTNRTHPETKKEFGNIILFSDRNMMEDIKLSLILYSDGSNANQILIRKDFHHIYVTLKEEIAELKKAYPTYTDVGNIVDTKELLGLARVFGKLISNTKRIQSYKEWEPTDWTKIGTTEEELENYSGKIIERKNHFNLLDRPADKTVLEEIEFALTDITHDTFDLAKINALLYNFHISPLHKKHESMQKLLAEVKASKHPDIIRDVPAYEYLSEHINEINTLEDAFYILGEQKNLIHEQQYIAESNKINIPIKTLKHMVALMEDDKNYRTALSNQVNGKGYSLKQKSDTKKEILASLLRLKR